MKPPALPIYALNAAIVRSGLCTARAWSDLWFNLARQNLDIVHATLHRRAEDGCRPSVLPHGPCWTDFYGHRESDIDVEHDV